MKRFLISSVLFLLITATFLVGGGCLIARLVLRSEYADARKHPVLFCGDSHVLCGLDPSYWAGSSNLAAHSKASEVVRAELDGIFNREVSSSVSTVIVNLPSHVFSYMTPQGKRLTEELFFSSLLGESIPFRDGTPVGYWGMMHGLPRMLSTILLTGKDGHSIMGYSPSSRSLWTESSQRKDGDGYPCFLKDAIERHYHDTSPPEALAGVRRLYLDMHSCVESKGTHLYLVRLPCHPRYRHLVPHENERCFQLLVSSLRQQGCHFIDLWDFPLPEDYFRDGDHLNSRGAAFVTKYLRRLIEG